MPQRLQTASPSHALSLAEVEGFHALAELALDRRWSWTPSTAELWRRLDPELWELTHNPLVILRTTSQERVRSMLADGAFRGAVAELLEEARRTARAPAWLRRSHPDAPSRRAAYFNMAWGSC